MVQNNDRYTSKIGKHKILILEDSLYDEELVRLELAKISRDFVIQSAQDRDEFINLIRNFKPEIVLSDFHLKDFNGNEALEITRNNIDAIFIFVSGKIGEEFAIEALKNGANDYVLKGNIEKLQLALTRAIDEKKMKIEREREEKMKQLILENISEIIYLIQIDRTTHSIRNLKFISNKIEDVLGFSAQEYEENPALQARLLEVITKSGLLAGKTNGPILREFKLTKKEGSEIWFEDSLVPVRGQDSAIVTILGSARDITERKGFEEERAAFAQSIFEQNEKLKAFADIVSHKIRGPLARIIGLLNQMQPEDFASNRYLQLVQDEAHLFDKKIFELAELLEGGGFANTGSNEIPLNND